MHSSCIDRRMGESCSSLYLKHLSSNLHAFRERSFLCDTTLVTSDRELFAHSVVLAAASPVFRSAFRECSASSHSGYRLEVLGLDGAVMELLLSCIYAGTGILLKTVDQELLVTMCEQLGLEWLKSSLSINGDCVLPDSDGDSSDHKEFVIKQETGQLEMDACSIANISLPYAPTGSSSAADNARSAKSLLDEFEGRLIAEPCENELEKEIGSYMMADGQKDHTKVNSRLTSDVYVCDICHRNFDNVTTLKGHRSNHHGCAFCTDCGHSFKSSAILKLHNVTTCKRKIISCNICDVSCVGFDELVEHTAVHSDMHRCSVCHQAFSDRTDLALHEPVHRYVRTYYCNRCDWNFTSHSQFQNHVAAHRHNILSTGNTCGVCKESFDDESQLAEHVSTHENSGVFLCCGTLFSLASEMHDHLRSHEPQHSAREYVCSDCGQSFRHQSNLTNHRRCHTGERPFVCSICGRSFKDNCLQKHMRMHERGARPHICTVCDRTFARFADLQSHLQCHTGEMRHSCAICHRLFRKKGTLSRHMRVHTGERPYVCETCGKSFKILFHLRLHTSTHSTERAHECSICGKTFCSAVRLKKHVVVHNGLKPYSCPICSRSFNRSANMRTHMRIHEGRRGLAASDMLFKTGSFECGLCQQNFCDLSTLEAHLTSHPTEVQVNDDSLVNDSTDYSAIEVMYCQLEEQGNVYIPVPVVHLPEVDNDSS